MRLFNKSPAEKRAAMRTWRKTFVILRRISETECAMLETVEMRYYRHPVGPFGYEWRKQFRAPGATGDGWPRGFAQYGENEEQEVFDPPKPTPRPNTARMRTATKQSKY